jgi:hypothetical protein
MVRGMLARIIARIIIPITILITITDGNMIKTYGQIAYETWDGERQRLGMDAAPVWDMITVDVIKTIWEVMAEAVITAYCAAE